MKIECLITFLDGKDRFETGDVRTVEDDRGARLVTLGWAKDLEGVVTTGKPANSADLIIHSAASATGDSNG